MFAIKEKVSGIFLHNNQGEIILFNNDQEFQEYLYLFEQFAMFEIQRTGQIQQNPFIVMEIQTKLHNPNIWEKIDSEQYHIEKTFSYIDFRKKI